MIESVRISEGEVIRRCGSEGVSSLISRMGTKVQCKSYLPGYYSMRDLNEDSNSGTWPLYYGDKTLTNGQYYNGFLPRTIADAYTGYDKDLLKQTMLEHEAIFKDQVHELHRLYRIQKNLMDEIKRKELHKQRVPVETSLSSSPLSSQIPSEEARKWHIPGFPLINSVCASPSVSGTENGHHPLSFMKGNGSPAGLVQFQNGGCSKDCEVLESRPTKLRRKMFNLQLPADEYIDTEDGEQFGNNKGPDDYPPNGNRKIAPESGAKLFLSSDRKTCEHEDISRSNNFCLRSTNTLADLNEPIQVEEAKDPTSVDFLGRPTCHGDTRDQELSTKPKSEFLGFPKGSLQNSHHGSDNGTLNYLYVESKGNGREWLPYLQEAGHSRSNSKSNLQALQPEKLPRPSQPVQMMLNKAHEPPAFLLTDQNKGDLWRERISAGLEISERSHSLSNYNHAEQAASSHLPSQSLFVPSSDLAKSWSHSSWENLNSSLIQKSISIQAQPFIFSPSTLSKSSQSSSGQSHGIFGQKWHLDSNCRTNPGFGSEVANRNGFYHGSSSGSKELPIGFTSIGFDYLSCSNGDSGVSEHSKGSNCLDVKSAKEACLYMVLSKSSSNDVVPRQSLEIKEGEKKHEDYRPALPWLRAKASKNEASNVDKIESSFFQSSLSLLCDKNKAEKGPIQNLSQNVSSAAYAPDVEAKEIEISSDCPSNGKILGFSVFEKPHVSNNESYSLTSPSATHLQSSEGQDIENTWKNRALDINLPCDPAVPDSGKQTDAEVQVIEKGAQSNVACVRNHIDLNSCITEDDALMTPVPSTNVKIALEIDLEAPVVPETETEEDVLSGLDSIGKQHDTPLQSLPQKDDEFARIAAEALVAISSAENHSDLESPSCYLPLETPSKDSSSLHWFAEVISSCADDLDSKFSSVLRARDSVDNDESGCIGIDYFEAMTLNLVETNVEEYLPKPAVPETPKMEETGTALVQNRTRKGQARRGRQRRDFQRDILPGLASLSRHEVTEDLQTFGGLMRATGHPWHSGMARRNSTRNGGARGRRRLLSASVTPAMDVAAITTVGCSPLVQQLTNIEMGLEDRSLTGWGKTTRRPRRQRCCPAGNLPTPLT